MATCKVVSVFLFLLLALGICSATRALLENVSGGYGEVVGEHGIVGYGSGGGGGGSGVGYGAVGGHGRGYGGGGASYGAGGAVLKWAVCGLNCHNPRPPI